MIDLSCQECRARRSDYTYVQSDLAGFSLLLYIFWLTNPPPMAFNPLPHMPILGSSNSAANKNMMSKIWTKGVQLPDQVENIVGKGEIARYVQFLLFLQCFQKLSVVHVSK